MIETKYNRISEKELIEAASDWIGTQFWHRGTTKAGCDCIGFVLGLFMELKLIPPTHLDYYPLTWWQHTEINPIMENMKEKIQIKRIENRYKIGDVFCYYWGMAPEAHCGIFVGRDRIIHSVYQLGVIKSDVKEPTWKNRFMFAYRLKGIN